MNLGTAEMEDDEQMNRAGGQEIEISQCFLECLNLYRKLLTLMSQKSFQIIKLKEVDVTKALEEYGRLRTWGEESRAIISANSRGSLDDVLRKDKELKDAVIIKLEKIKRLIRM